MAYPLHRACMKDEGAELVAALVRAGAQLESRKVWWGGPPSGRTQCWEGTPLFTAACIARYDSVQELVWQGASLRALSKCTKEVLSFMQYDRAGPPAHDAELAAILHPSTYRWVLILLSTVCPASCHLSSLYLCLQGVASPQRSGGIW